MVNRCFGLFAVCVLLMLTAWLGNAQDQGPPAGGAPGGGGGAAPSPNIPSPSPSPTPDRGGRTPSPFPPQQDPTQRQQQQFPEMQRPIMVSGKVVMEDGTPPPELVTIERVCNGQPRPEGYTDSKGRFSITLGQNQHVMQDASVGGADPLGVGNRVYMMANGIYSVISPESCAAIIWRDASHASKAASALKLTATDLLELRLIDGIIPEPGEGAHADPDGSAESLADTVIRALDELASSTPRQLIDERYSKFRAMGNCFEEISG